MAMNGARQSHCATSNAPAVGASTGTAVKIIVMSDMSRAASLPDATSRTMARASTMEEAAPAPWINRAASMTLMSVLAAATVPAMANTLSPT